MSSNRTFAGPRGLERVCALRRKTPFAAGVRARRRHLGLRQAELADLAGVSERFIYALESGKRSVQLDKVLNVLAALGLHLEVHRGARQTIEVTERISK